MDFKLNYEQEAIQKAAEEFARGEFNKDIALEHERSHSFPYEIWKKACQLGFVGIHYPLQYGGQGYGVLENVLVVEALCRQDSGLGIALSDADSSAEMILRYGTEEQKKKHLIPVTKEVILRK
jgi:acyl-CoA dehydrogenase